jgi:hypothetical protein
MLLFPGEIESALTHLAEQLDLDPHLVEACQRPFDNESYQDLIASATEVLTQRLGQKAGLASDQVRDADWVEKIDWLAAGVRTDQKEVLTTLCQAILDGSAVLPATPKTSRAILLLTDVLLAELEQLPDLVQPDDATAEYDARPFFGELVKSLNALLPYEQRDFPTQMTSTQIKLLLSNLAEDIYYAVDISPPDGEEAGLLEMGIHFESGDMEKLTRHFKRKIPGLSHSLGGKEIILKEEEGHLAILLHQPFQPSEKLSAFMTAATLVGLIGSIQERMPRR